MKPPVSQLLLVAGFSLIAADAVTAQTLLILRTFDNTNGAGPVGGLLLSGNTLFGTTSYGGRGSSGTVFKVDTNGAGFTTLHGFAATAVDSFGVYTNSEGASPYGGLVSAGNILYGATAYGGTYGNGTVFAVNLDGTGFTNLHHLGVSSTNSSGVYTNAEGINPVGDLTLSGSTLYGTARSGGISGAGTMFALDTDGTGFTNLHSFSAVSGSEYTNTEGARPVGQLILWSNALYGAAAQGGAAGKGSLFRIHTDGTHFTNLHSFSTTINGTNIDGAFPTNGLVCSGSTLYGTSTYGGLGGAGTVFALNSDGSGFTNLHSFFYARSVSTDTANPCCRLVLSGHTLYGETSAEVQSLPSTQVFKIQTDGTGFRNLCYVSSPYLSSGLGPPGGLALSGTTVFGTTYAGSGSGDLFSFSPSEPQLAVTLSETNLVLTWPADAFYFLQASTDLSPLNWTYPSFVSVVVDEQNVVTLPAGDKQEFFRLSPIPNPGSGIGPSCRADTDCPPGYRCTGGECHDFMAEGVEQPVSPPPR